MDGSLVVTPAAVPSRLQAGSACRPHAGTPGSRPGPWERKLSGDIENVGEAVGNWRFDPANPHMKNYERVQGIVVDTRYLMYNYIGTPEEQKRALAQCIERVLSRPDINPQMIR